MKRACVCDEVGHSLLTQELGILTLIQRGVSVLTANGDNLTDSPDPSRKMMRQIAGPARHLSRIRVRRRLVARLEVACECLFGPTFGPMLDRYRASQAVACRAGQPHPAVPRIGVRAAPQGIRHELAVDTNTT
jgi:hypothetical protein